MRWIQEVNVNKSIRYFFNISTLLILIFLSAQPLPVNAIPGTWYAAAGSVGANNCTIGNECSLWDAVENYANNGDTIYLRYGPYVAQDISDDEVLYIDKSLTIIGGCDPTYTTCELGYQYTSSMFDGDPHHDPVWPFTRVITIQGSNAFRPIVTLINLHIVRGNGYGIANDVACKSDGSSVTVGCGGGIYANQVASLTIQNCSFYDNSGAIESFSGAPAAGYGGAIYLQDVSNIHIINNEFNSNQAYVAGRGYGGAIAMIDNPGGVGTVEVKGNDFLENDCGQLGTTTVDKGCGIYILNTPNAAVAYNHFSESNKPASPQILRGSAIYANNSGGLHLLTNTFTGNYGSSVVEVWNDSATPDDAIERNKFWDNDAYYQVNYEGIFWAMIRNNFFGHNAPTRDNPPRGGGQTGVRLVTSGGPTDNTSAWIFFNTFAALDVGFTSDDMVLVETYYNIFAHIDGTAVEGGTSTSVVKNLYWDNLANGDTGSMPVYADPNLMDVSTGDFHLAYPSAAIGRASSGLGTPSEDIDMQVRPFGAGTTPYDLGADEFILLYFLPLLLK
jgi:hypothetical protein